MIERYDVPSWGSIAQHARDNWLGWLLTAGLGLLAMGGSISEVHRIGVIGGHQNIWLAARPDSTALKPRWAR